MCDITLLTSEANIQYVTGFHTTARRPKQIGPAAVILAGKKTYFLFQEKWRMQVEESVRMEGLVPVTYPNTIDSYHGTLAELLGSFDGRTAGIEYTGMELKTYLCLKERCPELEFVDITREMEKKRLVKRPEEIGALARSAKVAVSTMEHAKTCIRPGMTELECAAELKYHMRRQGSEGVPFTMKALSGENAAVVTRVPGTKQIREGEFVLLDFGAVVNGYASDWTRTFAVYSETEEMRRLHETVFGIEREVIAKIRPGVSMAYLVEYAGELAAKSPYGNYHNTHLGHSIGITCHEWPVLEPGVEGELLENMVITIEPGIYVPGTGGVRIEDEIVVTKDGYRLLTGLADEDHIIRKD